MKENKMDKYIKYIIEGIQRFNPADYDDEEQDIISQQTITDVSNTYIPKDRKELIENIIEVLDKKNYDLNCIDVGQITDFSNIFAKDGPVFSRLDIDLSKINIDVSAWDVSNGKKFIKMFYKFENFDCDLSDWCLQNGYDFEQMFYGCKNLYFDISKWDKYMKSQIASIETTCILKFKYGYQPRNGGTLLVINPFSCMFEDCESMRNIPDWEIEVDEIISKYSLEYGTNEWKTARDLLKQYYW